VAILGGGLAGTAASIHFARAGLSVQCIEPALLSGVLVGESLDWSAPPLLAELGFPMQRLLDERIATYKKHVIVTVEDGTSRCYTPEPWLARKPWNVEVRTLHIDRAGLRERFRATAAELKIPVLEDRVTAIGSHGDRIAFISTASGQTIQARFYLDASGVSARLMPRRIRPALNYGPQKVALWNYFTVTDPIEGTTLHTNCSCRRYMEWIWEIPINPTTVGVGYVATADTLQCFLAVAKSRSVHRTRENSASTLRPQRYRSSRVGPRSEPVFGDLSGQPLHAQGEVAGPCMGSFKRNRLFVSNEE
jgi:menaquinone-9 beta-reductase